MRFIRWIGAFVLGTLLWVIITFIAGVVFALAGFEYHSSWSNFYNLVFYPLGLWLGFRIIKKPTSRNRPY